MPSPDQLTNNAASHNIADALQRLRNQGFNFHGRIRRFDYIIFLIVYGSLLGIVLGCLIENPHLGQTGGIIALILIFIFIAYSISIKAKRCHDINLSGWWQLIPYFNIILLFIEGNDHTNKYGPDPKGRENPQTPK